MGVPTDNPGTAVNQRILIVDDNESIHADFRRILTSDSGVNSELEDLESEFFGTDDKPDDVYRAVPFDSFELDSAHQGQVGYEMVKDAIDTGRPYAVAFVDMRMPPGWDGLQTIAEMWKVDPALQVVICTAFSDHSWEDMVGELGETDQLLILKKPFDTIEARQAAFALSKKWHAQRDANLKVDDLTRIVAEHTKEISQANETLVTKNQALRDARREAEAASRTKSDFLANMSHEIRSPMTAIVGYTELLAEGEGEADAEAVSAAERDEWLSVIQRNGHHLLQLINELLDLAKVESGELVIKTGRFEIFALIDEVAMLLKARAEAKGLALEIEYVGQMPQTLTSDPNRLRQILINLIDNAIKFTSRGRVALIIRMNDSPTAPELRLEVHDCGIGLSEHQLERIFEPFSQAEQSTTRKFGGTGLGLSLSRRLAKLLGGDITVRSQPSVGSTFTVNLPVAARDAAVLVDPSNADQVSSSSRDPSRNVEICGRVLLVEDGPDNQRLIANVLERAGALVDLANDGRAGVEMARAANPPYDLILMDMQMPVMDGYTATRTLRQNDHYEGNIVALTAHAMAGDAQACIEAGCDDYATKPIGRGDLLDLVSRYV